MSQFYGQEMVNRDNETNVAPGGRIRIVSPTIAGIQASAVEHLARGHIFDAEGRRHPTRVSKRPRGYEPNHRNKNYTEGTIHINTDMKEHESMSFFL